jgi:hypothetical protein
LDFNGQRVTKYSDNSIYKVLGFGRKIYNSLLTGNKNILEAPYIVNFEDTNYLIMYIDQFTLNNSTADNINKSFAILTKNNNDINFRASGLIIKKYFPAPIDRLNKLTIKCIDPNGNLYDFQNKDFRLELMFVGNKHLKNYSSYLVRS